MTSLVNIITLLYAILNTPVASPLTRPTSSPANDFGIDINTTSITLHVAPDPQCIDSPDWVTPFFEGSDCSVAIDKFHNREYPVWSTTYLEFFTYRLYPPLPSIWAQRTPRRYRHKSCTMAIVMLSDMPPGIVPPPASRYSASDLASYSDLERAARGVLMKCISPIRKQGKNLDRRRIEGVRVGFANPTGFGIAGKLVAFVCIGVAVWCTIKHVLTDDVLGRHVSIGVFLWDTNSAINQMIPLTHAGHVI